jgi:hypothetical protein
MREHIGCPRITTGSDFLRATGKEAEAESSMIGRRGLISFMSLCAAMKVSDSIEPCV